MAVPPLTIRNLTTTPIELRLIERFEAAHSVEDGAATAKGNVTGTFTSLMSSIPFLSSPQLALKSKSFSHQDVSVPVDPFETKTTDVQPNPKEILRLTFETDGERHRLDTPTPSHRSTVLTPLTPNPRYEFTAVYFQNFSYLAIFSSAKLESWMSNLRHETPLSALSIPGTHNSPTCHFALPSVRCQAVSVREQLNNGVRFLDIRVQPEYPDNASKDGLILVHSAFPISLTGNKYFRDLMNEVFSFLDANPNEAVIISLKREGIGRATDQHLSKILHDHYANDTSRWFTENRIPTIGEVRKKVVVIRRFSLHESLKEKWGTGGWCIDAESWPDNCADGICSSGEIRVQDFYEVMHPGDIEKKIVFSQEHLERAAQRVCVTPAGVDATPSIPFFFNFLTASNFWRVGCWPDRIASKINPHMIDFLCRKHNETQGIGGPDGGEGRKNIGDGSTGIVVCDWVGHNGDWDLVRCIVGMNALLELKQKSLLS